MGAPSLPLSFDAQSQSHPGIQQLWHSKASSGELELAVPAEFGGPGGALSPEDLFNHALTSCFVGTFKVYAEKSKLNFEQMTTESRVIVDFGPDKKMVVKEFFLKAQIFRPSDSERALLLAKKASESGIILNSLKTQCHFEFLIGG